MLRRRFRRPTDRPASAVSGRTHREPPVPRPRTDLERLRLILGAPVVDAPAVDAPAVDGALVLSMRADDFELSCGQDISIGYQAHDATSVTRYLEASLTLHAHSQETAIALRYP